MESRIKKEMHGEAEQKEEKKAGKHCVFPLALKTHLEHVAHSLANGGITGREVASCYVPSLLLSS